MGHQLSIIWPLPCLLIWIIICLTSTWWKWKGQMVSYCSVNTEHSKLQGSFNNVVTKLTLKETTWCALLLKERECIKDFQIQQVNLRSAAPYHSTAVSVKLSWNSNEKVLAGFLCQNKVYFKVWNWQWLQEYEDNNNNCITKCLGRGPGRWGSSRAGGQHSAFSLFSVFSSVTALHCYTHYNVGCWNEHLICKTGWKINYYWNCEWAVY